MNTKVIFAAVFIAMLATTAAYAAPASANATQNNEFVPQRQMALSIPGSLLYDVNGTMIGWINATGHATITSNVPGFTSYSLIIRKLYVGARISAAAHDINVSTSTGIVTANIDINARLVIKVDIDNNGTQILENFDQSVSISWPARWLIPTGITRNFTIPFPAIESADPTHGTGSPTPINIRFTDDNDTWTGTKFAVNHVQWDFSNWLQTKIQNALNSVWANASEALQTAGIPGIQGGFNVVKCLGRVDLWKTTGTSPNNILLMAGGLIDLKIDFSLVGHGSINFGIGQVYNVSYDIDFFAEFGLYLALAVTCDWQFKVTEGGGEWSLNEFTIQVPENATIVWKKVGVIIYYGSYATQVDVTGGASRGSTHFDGATVFFVDYGWDGAPDFATNGTGMDQLTDHTGTTTGTGSTRNVTLVKAIDGEWAYLKFTIPEGYTLKAVYRIDGSTRTPVNVTQYWTDFGILYMCDDPAYTYTVELTPTGSAGLPTNMILIGAVAVVAVAAALVVVMRRKSSYKGVSIK